MATNPLTLPENSTRITGSSADYTYGSAKDDTTGTAGDGTPIKKAFMNDIYGLQQWILRVAGIVPSGNAETEDVSDFGDGLDAMFLPQARVNFDGTGTISIREGVNVASLTDTGAGNYNVNFTNDFNDTNYTAVASAGWVDPNPSDDIDCTVMDYNVGYVRIETEWFDVKDDVSAICLVVFSTPISP